jgi:hypothetical protein
MLKYILPGATMSILAIAPAFAADMPSWYPKECAIEQCTAVESAWVAPVGGGAPQLIVSSVYGQAIVQKTFPVGESEDGRIHACMRYDPFGSLEVTCLLVPSHVF